MVGGERNSILLGSGCGRRWRGLGLRLRRRGLGSWAFCRWIEAHGGGRRGGGEGALERRSVVWCTCGWRVP